MIAILSDIHGNLEAIDADLADIDAIGSSKILCLGDIIGYGPDPLPCIERAMELDIVLQRHCDQPALGTDDLPGFLAARHARKTILRFRELLNVHPRRHSICRFMEERPVRHADTLAQYVHGTLRNPLDEYLFPEAIYNQTTMRAVGNCVDRLCFCGHTHIAGVLMCDGEDDWSYLTPDEVEWKFSVSGCKVICNVGSVGQPRDEDVRASYVLFDGSSVTFRRVPYDVERTIAKIGRGTETVLLGYFRSIRNLT